MLKERQYGWRAVAKGESVESSRGQITQDPVVCLVGPSSLPPFSLPSFLSLLAVYPVAEPLSCDLGIFGISQLLVFLGGIQYLAINLKAGKTCSAASLAAGWWCMIYFSPSDAQAPVFKPEASDTKKHESWSIDLESRRCSITSR